MITTDGALSFGPVADGSLVYAPVGRLVQGGVSRYLVAHAPCPMLVLPRRMTAADSAGCRLLIVPRPGRMTRPSVCQRSQR